MNSFGNFWLPEIGLVHNICKHLRKIPLISINKGSKRESNISKSIFNYGLQILKSEVKVNFGLISKQL